MIRLMQASASTSEAKIAVVIVAAGNATRMGADTPKPYLNICGKTLLEHTIEAFSNHPAIGKIQVVIHASHQDYYKKIPAYPKLLPPVLGGAERQDSARLGLEALAQHAPSHVLIHDAARPCVSQALISRVCDALGAHTAVMPVMRMKDTVREQTDTGWQERPRDALMAVQTPQGFHFETILAAHRNAKGPQRTDDIGVILAYDAQIKIHAVEGEWQNQKMTTPDDMEMMAKHYATVQIPKVGMGYDVHRLAAHPAGAEQTIRLGGIDITHDATLEGHSDADVVLHAITDALLGTIAQGDIGAHFSPSDARWKNADSAMFLTHAATMVQSVGGKITHVDVAIQCEAPKIAPHRDAMRARIAEILALHISQVSVKATTTEGLGFTGRREGIAAHAVATVLFAASEAA